MVTVRAMNVRLLVFPVAVAVVAVAFWKFGSAAPAGVPACTWRIGTGTDIAQGRNFDELPAETPVRLSHTCDEPRYVYVFSHSDEDGTLLLFPSPLITGGQGNPLPAGNSVLPGNTEGKELAWTTRSGVMAATSFLAVSSKQKVAELEDLAAKLRLWSNSVFPDRSMQVTKPTGVGELLGKARSPLPSELLQRAAKVGVTEPNPNGPMAADPNLEGVWIASWKVREKKGEKKAPEQALQDKLTPPVEKK